MEYPLFSEYEQLYKKYLIGSRTQQLLEAAGNLKGKTVIDLCCGGGRLSKQAAAQGAYCVSVDGSEKMLTGFDLSWEEGIKICAKIEEFLEKNDYMLRADAVFCQQAVTYWLTESTAKSLAAMLKKQSVFVFNTFNSKPPEHPPLIKNYTLEEGHFTEISRLVPKQPGAPFDTVEHIQFKQGAPMHTTCFYWLSKSDFEKILSPYFNLQEISSGATSIWVCTRI